MSASVAKGTTLNRNKRKQTRDLFLGMLLPCRQNVVCAFALCGKKNKVLHRRYVYMCLYTFIHNTAINHTFSMCMDSSKLYTIYVCSCIKCFYPIHMHTLFYINYICTPSFPTISKAVTTRQSLTFRKQATWMT